MADCTVTVRIVAHVWMRAGEMVVVAEDLDEASPLAEQMAAEQRGLA